MNKILVADLLGTLLPKEPEYIKNFISSSNTYLSFKDYNRKVLIKK